MLVHEYARGALKLGLQVEKELGINPYKFGMIGSTDSHTSLATADDDNFFGKHSASEPSPDRMAHPFAQFGDLEILGWETLASGYAAVWATQRIRGKHSSMPWSVRETYATTGTAHARAFLRRLGLSKRNGHAKPAAGQRWLCRKGVPMGGDLTAATEAVKSPTFPHRRGERSHRRQPGPHPGG